MDNNKALPTESQERKFGIVTALRPLKGFGFAISQDRLNVFFRFAELQDGLIPNVGDRISFEPGINEKGPFARKIRIEAPPSTLSGGAL